MSPLHSKNSSITTDTISNQLLEFLIQNQPLEKLVVAFSGGLDSAVLLHLLVSLRPLPFSMQLVAVHVDHGINPNSNQWAIEVKKNAENLSVPCQIISLSAVAKPGESQEAVAREARYRAMQGLIESSSSALITAQHKNDQAETMLLQLLRGAGVDGLAAMPEVSNFSRGKILRPLLNISQEQLHDYADKYELEWVEDDSNQDLTIRRNYLRHKVIPLLEKHWPSAITTISRSAKHCATASKLLSEQTKRDFTATIENSDDALTVEKISINKLTKFPEDRQKNILRYWIKSLSLTTPSSKKIHRIITEMIYAREDAQPVVTWSGGEIRRYRENLYAMQPLIDIDSSLVYKFNLDEELSIFGVGVIAVNNSYGEGLDRSMLCNKELLIRFKQGGERCQLHPSGVSKSLKKIFQENGIPPWQRSRIPILFVDGELAAVVGLCGSYKFKAASKDKGVLLEVSLKT